MNYDVFVSYDELTGKDFATAIHRALTRKGYRVYVNHIEKQLNSGNFRNNIDRIINDVEVFVFVNTIDALTRTEIIREIKTRFPTGTDVDDQNFWVFRHDEEEVPRGTSEFTRETGIDLEKQNQSDFLTDSDVARKALAKCIKKRSEQTLRSLPELQKSKTIQDYTSPISELIEKFSRKFRRNGFKVEIEKEVSRYFRADLVLEKGKETILCEFKNNAEKIRDESFSGLLLLKNELEHILPNRVIKLWMIAPGRFTDDILAMGETYNILLIDDRNMKSYIDESEKIKEEKTDIRFGATIELDQKVYSWTDKVYITVVSPDFNLDPNSIDSIYVMVATRKHRLTNYKLIETDINTGIFTGQVYLTGFKHDTKGTKEDNMPIASTFGEGPSGGHLEAEDNDGLSVSFDYSDDETVVGSALIRWNIGEVAWLDANYPLNGKGTIRVIDPDMNLDPDKIDSFEITAWSDTDAAGTKIRVFETSESTGIFEGEITFTSKKSNTNNIQVSEGDTVVAEYTDRTLPSPYSITDKLNITATAFIGEVKPPLSRVIMKDLQIIDTNENYVDLVHAKKAYKIGTTIENNQNCDQRFALIMQIQNNLGTTIHNDSVRGKLSALQSLKPQIWWKPISVGKFTISLFIWESEDNPVALAPPIHTIIEVVE